MKLLAIGSFATFLLVLTVAGCAAVDSGLSDDVVEVGADGIADLAVRPETLVPGSTLAGRVVDGDGSLVPKAMLVMCGNVAGKEVCNQQLADEKGGFLYDSLEDGYTHLTVMTFQSALETGKKYGGLNLLLALPPVPFNEVLNDIVVPIVTGTQVLVVAEGGTLEFGAVTLEIPAGVTTFPGLEDEGDIGVVQVTGDAYELELEPAGAFAFYPFSTGLNEPATVSVDLSALEGFQDADPTAYTLYINSMDDGGLVPLDTSVDGMILSAQISVLTWVVVIGNGR